MKAVVAAFNQEKALVGAFSVIVQLVVEPIEHYTALVNTFLLYLELLLEVIGDKQPVGRVGVRTRALLHVPRHRSTTEQNIFKEKY